jgi:YXWGXW repeat-containing protein
MPMKKLMRPAAAILALAVAAPGCYRHGGGLFAAMAGTAIVTAAVVSAAAPPPARVVYVPAPRPGYSWQPGYWTLDDGEWVWVEGRWISHYRGYTWQPAHWERDPDGYWRLVPGYWLRR